MFGVCRLCKTYGWDDGDGSKELVLQVLPPVSLDTTRMGNFSKIYKIADFSFHKTTAFFQATTLL